MSLAFKILDVFPNNGKASAVTFINHAIHLAREGEPMEILALPFQFVEWLIRLFIRTPERVRYRRKKTVPKPRKKPEPKPVGETFEGIVLRHGNGVHTDPSSGKKYCVYTLVLKDEDGVESVLRGRELRQLAMEGKLVTGTFLRIGMTRSFISSPNGRRRWKNNFFIYKGD